MQLRRPGRQVRYRAVIDYGISHKVRWCCFIKHFWTPQCVFFSRHVVVVVSSVASSQNWSKEYSKIELIKSSNDRSLENDFYFPCQFSDLNIFLKKCNLLENLKHNTTKRSRSILAGAEEEEDQEKHLTIFVNKEKRFGNRVKTNLSSRFSAQKLAI